MEIIILFSDLSHREKRLIIFNVDASLKKVFCLMKIEDFQSGFNSIHMSVNRVLQ